MTTDVTLTPSAIVAGAIERYCDNLGEPMPSPALARALGTVAVEVIAQLADQDAAHADLMVASDEARIVGEVLRNFAALLRKDQP